MISPLLISGLFAIFAYLVGSTPTGYLAGKWLRGIDIREHGSGSIGATNVLRTLGKPAAIAVLLIDALKGVLAVYSVHLFYALTPYTIVPIEWKPWLITLTGLAVVIGHSRSIWLKFTGGKSVATSIGVLFVMNPVVALGTIAVFGVTLALSRIVSLGSILGAIAVNFLMLFLRQPLPYELFVAIAGVYVILRHRTNIQRLLAGTEPKLGQKLPQEQI